MNIVPVADVLAIMLTLPQYVGDRFADTTIEDRTRLYRPVAVAISAVAKNLTEAATLLALGHHETAFARYVLDGHCEQGPVGARCDWGRVVKDEPAARGPWQVWRWCTGAWEARDGSPEEKLEGAKCAIRRLRSAQLDCSRVCRATGTGCKPLHAAFSGYAGRGCEWGPAARRVKTANLLEGRLRARLKSAKAKR